MHARVAKLKLPLFGMAGGHNRVPSPYPWLMPVILVMGLFYLYPVIDVFRYAFTDLTLIGGDGHYTVSTIINVLSRPELLQILWVTFVFTAGSVIGQQLLGVAMALVVVRSEKRHLFGTTMLRTTALIAWVVPGIAGGIIWKMLFNEAPFGGLNSILRLMGMAPVQWLSDPDVVMWSVVLSNVWRGTAFSMVVMYAALKAIDPTLYEAAEVDGATSRQRLLYVTLPQLRPAILVNMILITIQTLNTFDAIISLTGGGPGRATEVLSLYTFNVVFRNYDLAAGSVLSILMLAISLGLALVYAAFLPKEEKVMKLSTRDRLGDVLSYAFMALMFVFFSWPLIWLLSIALRTRKEVFLGVARLIPKYPTLDNFIQVLTSSQFPVYLFNALKLSCLSAVGCLIVAAPAAYAFSRFDFKSKSAWMLGILAFQMISPLVIMVPLYRYMSRLGLLDSHFGVVMVYIALSVPMVTWLLKGFMDGIPKSLDEAALIDGCNRLSVFVRIILPLSTPGVASAFIITVISGWSQFLVPFLLITKDSLTPIGVGIFQYAGTQNDSSIQILAAACLISVVPAIIAFLALQRLILSAMTAGAVKG